MTATRTLAGASRVSMRYARRGALMARRVSARRSLATVPAGARVHLGCGQNHFDGWIDVDIKRGNHPDLRHDLRLGLPLAGGSVERVYSEHVFEHFEVEDGERLMRDCYRALSPTGVMRIAMPDLAVLVGHYLGDWQEQAWLKDGGYRYITSAAQMLNVALHEWGHRHVYDFADLHTRLTRAGFTQVKRVAWGESEYDDLRGLETRADSLLVVEAQR